MRGLEQVELKPRRDLAVAQPVEPGRKQGDGGGGGHGPENPQRPLAFGQRAAALFEPAFEAVDRLLGTQRREQSERLGANRSGAFVHQAG